MTTHNAMSADQKQKNMQASTVARFFDDWASASRAVDALHAAGFRDDQIGILARDRKNSATRTDGVRDGDAVNDDAVVSGAATGAAIGGVTGLLAALAALAIPGVGPLVAGGVLATTLGTAAAGTGIGAAAGGLIGALTGMGFSEDDARFYDEGVRNGGTLVTVHNTDRVSESTQILEKHGGRQRSL
jgi:hypothetical protein